jgi:ferritin
MTNTVENAINEQIKEELFSAYLYLSMSAHSEGLNLKGFASWFGIQVQEELDHARGLYNFMNERGGKVILQALDQPQNDFAGPLSMMKATLEHEQQITGKINALYELAQKEKDYPLESILKWYVDEQVEEEATAAEILNKVKLIGEDGANLYLLDKELGARAYTPASIIAKV